MVALKRSHKAAFAVGAALVIGATISAASSRQRRNSGAVATSTSTSLSAMSPLRTGRRLIQEGSIAMGQHSSISLYEGEPQQQDDKLECRLSLFEKLEEFQEGSYASEELYMCNPLTVDGVEIDQEYVIEIDESLQEEYRAITDQGYEPVVSVTGATIDKVNAQIELSEDSRISIIDSPDRRRRRKLLSSHGKLTALAVRIVMTDAEPDYSVDELYKLLFQDSVSLKNQYKACSFGKLIIEPASGEGVIEVKVNFPASISNHQAVVNAASSSALDYLYEHNYGSFSNMKEFADMVLYITPTLGKWLAYASVGGTISVYNNKWGGYISSIMHETG